VILSKSIEEGRGPIKASIVDDPSGQPIRRIAQSSQPLNQASDHSFFISRCHHHIEGGELSNR
jgi:hypothetical protein